MLYNPRFSTLWFRPATIRYGAGVGAVHDIAGSAHNNLPLVRGDDGVPDGQSKYTLTLFMLADDAHTSCKLTNAQIAPSKMVRLRVSRSTLLPDRLATAYRRSEETMKVPDSQSKQPLALFMLAYDAHSSRKFSDAEGISTTYCN